MLLTNKSYFCKVAFIISDIINKEPQTQQSNKEPKIKNSK